MRLLSTILISSLLSLFILELGVRYIAPQVKGPQLVWSKEFGFVAPKNSLLEHSLDGVFNYTYHINSQGFRGQEWTMNKNFIFVLGDSYSFGQGVTEGKQYSAIVRRNIFPNSEVINLSTPGWGITQQIKAYLLYSKKFRPKTIILQYASNDPLDNLHFPVIAIENKQFKPLILQPPFFIKWFPRVFRKILYKFQSYQYLRLKITAYLHSSKATKTSGENGPNAEQVNHLKLLKLFVKKLQDDQTKLIFLYHGPHLSNFQNLTSFLKNKKITKLDANSYFKGAGPFDSPDGHEWGEKGHAIIAQQLITLLRPGKEGN
ncbi:MAG: SGNH/GDSL hydrolase family protein [Halobacteriovoraceae bacterium]|jgi:hypothetical protein|nr:SGNH/GDSL hydrolase family protein [Halobacteriovoraceae bacterium]MBT5094872.1 SGNH/GDSL hydrolase family protein [Halobacteriovoraceae bacterium]